METGWLFVTDAVTVPWLEIGVDVLQRTVPSNSREQGKILVLKCGEFQLPAIFINSGRLLKANI